MAHACPPLCYHILISAAKCTCAHSSPHRVQNSHPILIPWWSYFISQDIIRKYLFPSIPQSIYINYSSASHSVPPLSHTVPQVTQFRKSHSSASHTVPQVIQFRISYSSEYQIVPNISNSPTHRRTGLQILKSRVS